MTTVAAPLGILAFFNLLASSCCAWMPADPSSCGGGREIPRKAPEQPTGCHAVLGCGGDRKIRTIP